MKNIKEKNSELESKLMSLQPLLQRRDIVGYAAARNTRTLMDTLTEYINFKNDIMCKYGEEEKDEEGNPTGKIYISSDNPDYDQILKDFTEICNIEHDVQIMTLEYEKVIDVLSGEEILSIDWMLEDAKQEE